MSPETKQIITCLLCGRNKFAKKEAHNCNGNRRRKRGLKWKVEIINIGEKDMSQIIEMEPGKIYSIHFGENTQLIARFKNEDACNYHFFDELHYWNGSENFHSGKICYCVKHGITELRRATKAEIHSLVKFEIENGCI